MRSLKASSSPFCSSALTRRSGGFSLLETLVALVLLIVLTLVVAGIFRHHTQAPAQPVVPAEEPSKPILRSPADEVPLLRPSGTDTATPPSR